MPRTRKRSALKNSSNLQNEVVDKEQADKAAKVQELYKNWRAGEKSQNKMMKKIIDDRLVKSKREIDDLIFRLPSDILNMKVADFCNTFDECYKEIKSAPEAENSEETENEPIVPDNVMCAVDKALMDLQQGTSGSDGESRKKASKKKTKKAPPKTARKRKKPGNAGMDTPCNTNPPVDDWKSTPYYTPKIQPRMAGIDSATTSAESVNWKNVYAKIVFVSDTGSPLPNPVGEKLRKQIAEQIKVIEQAAREDGKS